MLNAIWLALVATSLLYAAASGPETLAAVTQSIFDSAKAAVSLVIGLVGVMVFFLGLMRVAFDAGLRDAVARWLAPLMRRLFPEVPAEHPAMGAMLMNFASNVLGMGNAATPFGLKAMQELARLNRHRPQASNSMVLFLAINASAITLLPPLGTIGVRAAANSADPWAIWMPTLFATLCSTGAAVTTYYLLAPLPIFASRAHALDRRDAPAPAGDPASTGPSAANATDRAPADGNPSEPVEGEPGAARPGTDPPESAGRRGLRRGVLLAAWIGFVACLAVSLRAD